MAIYPHLPPELRIGIDLCFFGIGVGFEIGAYYVMQDILLCVLLILWGGFFLFGGVYSIRENLREINHPKPRTIYIICPRCGWSNYIPIAFRGRTAQCSRCGTLSIIP